MTEIEGLGVHGGDDHARDNLDGVCEECGTNHRVLESIPNQPIDTEKIEALASSEGVVFARSIVAVPGGIVGSDAEKVSEDIVLGTTETVRTVTRYGESGGWIVKQELPVPEDRDPERFAFDVYVELASEFSHVDENEIEREDLIQ